VAEGAPSRFAVFLERSLQLLSRDAPEHFAAMRAHAHNLAVIVAVEGSAPVRLQLDVVPWLGPAGHAEVLVALGEDDLDAILEGVLGIEHALERDRLLLRGELVHLLSFFAALDAWLHGAMRCAAMPALFDDYLARVAAPASA
jgi:hypothetical protein